MQICILHVFVYPDKKGPMPEHRSSVSHSVMPNQQPRLYETLFHHCSSDLFETSDVTTLDEQVLVAIVLLSSSSTVLVNVDHDLVQLIIYILMLVYSMTSVLSHFDAGAGISTHTTYHSGIKLTFK